MTTHEAKSDVKQRLGTLPFAKLTAKTVDFGGFGYGQSIFVTVHGLSYPGNGDTLKAERFAGRPKPSEGGYVLNFQNCQWNTATKI